MKAALSPARFPTIIMKHVWSTVFADLSAIYTAYGFLTEIILDIEGNNKTRSLFFVSGDFMKAFFRYDYVLPL